MICQGLQQCSLRSFSQFFFLHAGTYWDLDKVFGGDCSTRQVYKEGAKEVALSVLTGINCEYNISLFDFILSFVDIFLSLFQIYNWFYFSIMMCAPASVFAYGQTSSGKTFTMTGITEYTISDIYDYIQKVIQVNCIFSMTVLVLHGASSVPVNLLDVYGLFFLAHRKRISFEVFCNGDL